MEEQRKEAEKKFSQMEGRLEQQKKAYAESARQSEERLQDMERKLEHS